MCCTLSLWISHSVTQAHQHTMHSAGIEKKLKLPPILKEHKQMGAILQEKSEDMH